MIEHAMMTKWASSAVVSTVSGASVLLGAAIDHTTQVPLGVAATVAVTAGSIIWWLSSRLQSLEDSIQDLREMKQTVDSLRELKVAVAAIHERLDGLPCERPTQPGCSQ